MSRTTTGATYPTINTVGALLPPDLLTRLANGELDHLAPGTYGLPDTFTLRQAAARAWELLLPTYRSFQTRLSALSENDPATTITRDRWTTVLLRELGYDLEAIPNIQIDDDTFDVRHLDGHVPVHMLGWNVDLDKRAATNIRGASRTAPHSLIQELLNRADAHLWAILTNGKRLRLLRDNVVMGRPAYIEFDLEGMFTGEQFADFAILYALAHSTRLRSSEPATCILERWRSAAINDGTRALNHLREGFVAALTELGSGFLSHPSNRALRDLVARDPGAADDFYRWLLRLVYRLIFLFVVEDRDLLHPDGTSRLARARYVDFFSTRRLRALAQSRRAGRHADLWLGLQVVFDALGGKGEDALGLPPLGSTLFEQSFLGVLPNCKLSNSVLLDAVRGLSQLHDRESGTIRAVDYRHLGAEELGGVYEALLEYIPAVTPTGNEFTLTVASGNTRKATGAYYTPAELVGTVLEETLDPQIAKAFTADDPELALLAITVCDPACGSGHFLVAAARRLARAVAVARTGDPEPTEEAVRDAMRDVVSRCIFGVDLNDMAIELAKVGLWLEALTPGKPLNFLDSHLKVGNALLGATPRLLLGNIPDDAFASHTRETNATASALKKRNKYERENLSHRDQMLDMEPVEILVANTNFAREVRRIESADDDSIESLRLKADSWRSAQENPSLGRARLLCDVWVAASVWPIERGMRPEQGPPTYLTLNSLQHREDLEPLSQRRQQLEALGRKYRFFHWHLEFPQIFQVPPSGLHDPDAGWAGGFSCVVGNPPYLDSESLKAEDPAQRHAIEVGWSTAKGNWDLFVPFVELASVLTKPGGRHAMVTPNKILGVPYVSTLQQRLLRYRPFRVHDYSSVKVFRDAAVNVVVLAVEKSPTTTTDVLALRVYEGTTHVDHEVDLSAALSQPPGFAFANVDTTGYVTTFRGKVGDIATLSDGASTSQAYEIREIVTFRADADEAGSAYVKLANTGTIDPFRTLWGLREAKYLGFKHLEPVVPVDALRTLAPKRLTQALSPKVMLAGMASMLEAVADPDGAFLCGKSAVLIIPNENICAHALTTFLNAPQVTAYYKAMFGAQGFGSKSMNIGPKQVAQVPCVPVHYLRPADDEWEPESPQDALNKIATKPVLSAVGRMLAGVGTHDEWTPEALDALVGAIADLPDAEEASRTDLHEDVVLF